jgi:hypothetical protein
MLIAQPGRMGPLRLRDGWMLASRREPPYTLACKQKSRNRVNPVY